MVIDTDVLIWYMKGNKKAYKIIENLNNFYISVVTYMELLTRQLKVEIRPRIVFWDV